MIGMVLISFSVGLTGFVYFISSFRLMKKNHQDKIDQ